MRERGCGFTAAVEEAEEAEAEADDENEGVGLAAMGEIGLGGG